MSETNNLDVRVRLIDARLAQLEAQKTSRAIAGIGKASKKASEDSKALGGVKEGIHGLLGMGGVIGLAFGLKDVTEAGLGLQSSQTKLQNALMQTKGVSADTFKSLQDSFESLSTKGGGSVEEMNAGLAQFLNETQSMGAKSLEFSKQTNQAAVDLSIKTGMSYVQAQGLMASALAGRVKGIQKYIGIVQPVKTAEDQLAMSHKVNTLALQEQAKAMGKAGPLWLKQQELLAGITPQMKAAAVAADKVATSQAIVNAVLAKSRGAHESTAQKIQDMRHSFQNLEANLGTLLIPLMNKLAQAGEKVSQFLTKHKKLVTAVAIAVGILVTAWEGMKIMKSVYGFFVDLGKAATATTASLFGTTAAEETTEAATASLGMAIKGLVASTIIGILFVALVELIMHWREVRRIAEEVWKAISAAVSAAARWIVTAFHNTINWVKQNWPLLLAILIGPFGLAVGFIVQHFNDIKRFIGTAVKDIGHVFSDIFHFLIHPFELAINWIKKHADLLNPVHWIKAGAGVVGHVLDSINPFSTGGPVRPIYRAAGGPSGTDTVPAWLTPGEFVMRKAAVERIGMPALERMNAGGGEPVNIVIEPQTTILKVGERVMAEAVTKYTLKRNARGSTSLVGGGLITGVSRA